MILKKYKTIPWLAIALLLANTNPLHAQDSAGIIKAYMQQLQTRYHNAGYLGFHIKYLYANSGKTAAPMDSLSGEVEMQGDQCRLLIDNTETVVTGKYTIQVRPDEKLVVLSATHPTGSMDPVGLMDSLLKHTGDVRAGILHQPGEDILAITFPPGREYNSIRLISDPHTGYLQRISYVLQTANWVEQEMISRPGHPAPYQPEGRIDILFSHYRKGAFNATLFNESNYFNKVDGRFEATGRYKDYRIFLASPNL